MWAGMVRSNDDELSRGCKPDARGNALSEHEKTVSHKTNLLNFVDVVCKGDLTSLGGVTLPGDKDRDGRIVIGTSTCLPKYRERHVVSNAWECGSRMAKM